MPYGITECYLPPGRGDISIFTPAEAGTRFSNLAVAFADKHNCLQWGFKLGPLTSQSGALTTRPIRHSNWTENAACALQLLLQTRDFCTQNWHGNSKVISVLNYHFRLYTKIPDISHLSSITWRISPALNVNSLSSAASKSYRARTCNNQSSSSL